MAKIKVVVTDFIEPDLDWEVKHSKELGIEFQYFQLKQANPDQLLTVIHDADVVIVNMAKITAEVITGLKKCRLIIRHGIGYDNVDIEAATAKQIMVGYVPDYCISEVAEQAVTLIMACQRKLPQQIKIIERSSQIGQWDFTPINPIFSMRGKTVAIIGFGRIGRTVFQMLQGFGVNFRIVDPYLGDAIKQQYGINVVSLETALQEADVVTIHCPLRWEETYHMFDMPQFRMMKKTATLINTARGGIVNLDALDIALNEGLLSMAGIDVYEVEPPPADFPLLRNPRAICAPHLSWLSEESGWNIRHKIMKDVERFLQGLSPLNQVNKEIEITQSLETP